MSRSPHAQLMLAAVLAAASLVACNVPVTGPVASPRPESTELALPAELFVGRLRSLHDHHAKLEIAWYHANIVGLHFDLAQLGNADRLARMALLAEQAEVGADGLEPLFLAYADAIARTGTPAQQREARALLTKARANARFLEARPFPRIVVPIGRFDAREHIDIRGDAARVLLHALLEHDGLPALDTLAHDPSVRARLCGLKAIPRELVEEAPELADVDRRRAELCAGSDLGPRGALALVEIPSKVEHSGTPK